jgi:hypothetical protein
MKNLPRPRKGRKIAKKDYKGRQANSRILKRSCRATMGGQSLAPRRMKSSRPRGRRDGSVWMSREVSGTSRR